jgi:hypothetical protein
MKVILRSFLAVAALALLAGSPAVAKEAVLQHDATSQAAPSDYEQGYQDGLNLLQGRDLQLIADEIQKANYLLEQATTLREYDYINGYLNGLNAY